MKKLLLLFGVFLSGTANAAEMHISDLSSGMYSYQSPNKIPDTSAAYIQNFFTDIQGMAVERNGSVLVDSNVGSLSKSVPGLWKFVDVSGNEWLIEYSSRTYYKHTVGNSPTAFGPVTTTSNIPRAATNLGKIMFVDGVDSAWTFDGTSTATVAGAPIGTLIVPWRTRFVIADITGAQSTVRFSADGDATSWVLGALATDPFSIQIGGANDGSYVRCMGNYLDYLIIQRKYDTWAASGFDQSDIQNRNVSSEIGCIEPGTNREFDGSYLFLSWRGMEQMDGFTIKSISDPIRNITDVLVKNASNQRSNLQTTQTDWTAGTEDRPYYLDYQTVPGSLQFTFPDNFGSFRDGTNGSKTVWAAGCTQSIVANGCTNTPTGTSNVLTLNTTGDAAEPGANEPFIATAERLNDITQGVTIHFRVNAISKETTNQQTFYFALQNTNTQVTNNVGSSGDFVVTFKSTNTNVAFMPPGTTSSNGNGTNIGISTQISIPFYFDLYLSTGHYSFTINGSSSSSGVANFNGVSSQPYVCMGLVSTNHGTVSTSLSNFAVTPETGTFTSQLLSIGTAITSWGPVTISDIKTGGNITYTFGSTNTASISAISNFTSITSGAVPTVSTNAYAAFKAVLTNTSTTTSVHLDEFDTYWNEGGAVPSPIAINYDRRYWISLTTVTSASPAQDTVYVLQRNHTWTSLKGLNAGSFALWRDNLVFGDATSGGNVYQYDVGNNDNGAAISSQIVFKSYDAGTAYRDKDFRRTYLTFLGGSSGSFSLGFFNEQGSTLYSLGSVNMNDGSGQVFEKYNFPLDGTVPLQGRELQYSLTKSGTGDRLKLFDITLDFAVKEAR